MFIEIKKVTSQYTRNSRLGQSHTYLRTKTIVLFLCDNCDQQFERDLGKMDHRRTSNKYYHVCPKCNPKQFAQKKGVERRLIWDLPVNSELDISRI
jgi:hypothetical protein